MILVGVTLVSEQPRLDAIVFICKFLEGQRFGENTQFALQMFTGGFSQA